MIEQLFFLLGAPQGGSGSPSTATTLLPFILIFAVFYLLILRPQSKKQKAMKQMIANVAKGDKVITIGGIHGVVTHVEKATVVIKIDDNVKIKFNKESVASVVADKPTTAEKPAENPTKGKSKKAAKEEAETSTGDVAEVEEVVEKTSSKKTSSSKKAKK